MLKSAGLKLLISQIFERLRGTSTSHKMNGDHGRRQVGDGGTRSPSRKINGRRVPEIRIFQYLFFQDTSTFSIFQHFQNKVALIREETKFWGYVGFGACESVPPPPPQSKLRVDALDGTLENRITGILKKIPDRCA